MTAKLGATIPAKLRRYGGTERDSRGNVIVVYSDPADVLVWGWWTGAGEVDMDGHAARIEYDATCYLPLALGVKVLDKVELGGQWYETQLVNDYTNNPWWNPGLVDIKLRRVDG